MSRSAWRSFVSDAGGLAALALVSLGFGLLLNRLQPEPLPLVYRPPAARLAAAFPPGSLQTARLADTPSREISLEDFQAAASGQILIIDARPAAFYRQGHIPGAVNLSREHFPADYARAQAALTAHADRSIAVYCSGEDCEDSTLVAGALSQRCIQPILIFRGGWAEWTRAGLPEESAP